MGIRVMHLIHSGGFYGAEAVVLNLSLGLRDLGVHSMVGCLVEHREQRSEVGIRAEKEGLEVKYILMGRKLDIHLLNELKKIFYEYDLDLFHSHGYRPSFYCSLLQLLYRVPYVITCHLWTKDDFKLKAYSWLDRVSMIFAKGVAAVSHPIASDIGKIKILRKKVHIINNGIDIRRYPSYSRISNQSHLRAQLGLRMDTRLVGTLGRLTPQKAHHHLIEAAAQLLKKRDNIEFLIAGAGPLLHNLRLLVEKYNISEHFHLIGFQKDVINILRLLDVFVLCSIDEGLPVVLLEAMSVGVPIIATRVGEIPRVICHQKNGLLVVPNDVKGLVLSIEKILDDKKFSMSLARDARITALNEFSISNMAMEYAKLYHSVLNLGTGSRKRPSRRQ